MRKVLSFVLVLSLVLGSFGMAFAAAPVDVVDTDYEAPVEVLMSLGVVTGYPDGTYKPEGAVTRAEMAALIVRTLGLEDTANFVGASSFSDMAGHWADKYVAVIAGKGIVNGYPDGTFKPSAQVSFPEAITMVVRALGYIDGCESLVGAWPVNYLTLAEDLGITDDVTVILSGTADRGAVATMIYNALTVRNVSVNLDGTVTERGEDDDPITFLSKLDCYLKEDVRIQASWVGDDDETLIDLTDYVYAVVDVYYNDDDAIIAIDDIVSDTYTGELDLELGAAADNDGDFADDVLVLDDDDDTEIDLDDLATNTAVYLNGKAAVYEDVDDEYIDGFDVTVYGEFDEDDDEIFATISGIIAWAPTAIHQVDDDDIEDIADAIEDQDGDIFGISLPTDDDELDMDVIDVTGDVDSLEDIEEDDVVYVYAASDDSKVKFEVTRDVVEEVDVTKKASSKVYVGSTSYKFVSLNNDVAGSPDGISGVDVDGTYTFYLDANGKIAFYEEIEGTTALYGVVLAYDQSTSFGDTTYEVKMLTAEGEQLEYELDSDVWDIVSGGSITGPAALVEYDVDSDGIITEMESITDSLSADEYNERTGVLDSEDVASDVVVFDVSSDKDSDDWDVTSLSDEDVVTGSYILNDDNEIAAIAFTDSTGADSTTYFALNEVGKVVNAEDDVVLEFIGFEDGDEKTVLTDDDGTISLSGAPGFYYVDYSGSVITLATAVAGSMAEVRTMGAVVADSSDIKLELEGSTTKWEVSEDVVVYVEVYDNDDQLDYYEVGNMNDVDREDEVTIITNDDDNGDLITIIVVTDEDDAAFN